MTAQELFDLLMAYPQPTRTEILSKLEEITRNYDPGRVEALLTDFADMLVRWQCDETYNLAKWKYEEEERQRRVEYEERYGAYESELTFAHLQLAFGSNEPIEWPDEPELYEPFLFKPPLPGDIADNIYIPGRYNYAVEVLKSKLTDEERPPLNGTSTENPTGASPEPWRLPIEMDTPEAQGYIDKAVELGLMIVEPIGYRWLKSMQLLSCFSREMSLKLKLGKGRDKDNPRISWKECEQAFNIPKGKLRDSYNCIQKTGESPIGIELIDQIFG